MSTGGFVMGAVSTLMDSVNTYNQGQMSAASLKAQRTITAANAKVQEGAFDWTIERTLENNRRETSRVQALMGKSGVTFEGSMIEVYEDTLYNMELDIIALEIDKLSAMNAAKTSDDFMRIEQKYAKRQANIMAIGGGLTKLFTSAASQYGGTKGADSTTSFSTSRGVSRAPVNSGATFFTES